MLIHVCLQLIMVIYTTGNVKPGSTEIFLFVFLLIYFNSFKCGYNSFRPDFGSIVSDWLKLKETGDASVILEAFHFCIW